MSVPSLRFKDGIELPGTQSRNNGDAPAGTAQQVFNVSGKWYSGRHWWMTGSGQMVFSERIIGRFDDLAVYKRAISDSEVTQLYQALRKN
jgi:hypothetical protein